MTTDARARRQFSEGLALLEDGIRKLRLGVEIERTLHDTSEPDSVGKDAVRLSPVVRNGQTQRTDVQ